MPCMTDGHCLCRCGSAHYCTHRCMKDDKDVHVQSGECNLLQADSARQALIHVATVPMHTSVLQAPPLCHR